MLINFIYNIDTNEIKLIKRKVGINSFFNFFCNLKTPNEDDIKKISFETEKELGIYIYNKYKLNLLIFILII